MNKTKNKWIVSAASAALVASAIVPVASAASFSDIENSDHKEAILALAEAGIISGYTDGTFKPNAVVTRGNVTKLLGKWLVSEGYEIPEDYNKVERFTDLPVDSADQELVKYAALVKDEGVFKGSNDKLMQANNMSREQMAVVLVRALKTVYNVDLVADYKAADFESKITDLDKANADENREAIIALEFAEITKVNGLFNPKNSVTRGQFASFLHRAIENVGKEEVKVESVTAVNGTLTVKLAEKAEAVDVKDFKVTQAINGGAAKEVTPSKVVLSEDGLTATLTVDEVAAEETTEQSVVYTVNEVAASAFVVEASTPEVKSVNAINATEVEIKFTQPVDKVDAETSANTSIQGVSIASRSLSDDGMTLTLKASAPINVKGAAVVVEPIMSKADKLVKTEKFVSLLTYKDEVAPTIKSVEAKTNGTVATSLTVTASEPIKSGALAKVDGNYVTINFNNTNTAVVTGLKLDASKAHTIELINLEDLAGNKTVSSSASFNVSVDNAAPTAVLTTQSDKNILVTFNKSMNVAATEAALANGVVKDEALAPVNTGTATVVPNTDNKQFLIPITDALYTNKDSRTLTVVLKDTIVDALGNKVVPATQSIALTKDSAKPVATGYTIVRDADGKVKAIEVNFSEGLKASGASDSIVAGQTLHQAATTIVNENGVAETTKFANYVSKAVAAGDTKVVFEAATAEAITGKFAISFKNELVKDLSETGNKSAAFNYTVDFGQGQSVTEFDVTSAVATSANVITVTYPEAVKGGAVANSATDISNYTLAGKPLAEGTTITLDSAQKVATITLPADSVSKDDLAAVFTVANVKNTAGTKTVKSYIGTVDVKDNVAPVLQSAKILDNKTIELTYSEAIQIDAAGTNKNVGNSFVIKQGDTVLSLADAELTAAVASGFETKLVLTIAKGSDTPGTPASATKGGANESIVTLSNQTSATKTGSGTFVIQSDGKVWNTTDSNAVVGTLTGASGSWAGSFVFNGVTVTIAGGTDSDTFTVNTTAAVAPTFATTLDLTKDITIETKAATTKKVVDKSTAKNEHKATVKVNVVKP